MFGRFSKGALLALAILFVALAATTSTASGQESDATLDIAVRYQDGSLVTDKDVCIEFYGRIGDGLGFANEAAGPQVSFNAGSGGQYALRVKNCRFGDGEPLNVSLWHNGTPARDALSPWDSLILNDLILAEPGSNPIVITVGAARISGTVTGPNATGCRVAVIGTNALSQAYGPVAFSGVAQDGTWEAHVPPGGYRAEVSCFLRSAFEAWPNKAFSGEATTITVANGRDRNGINFDISDRFDETEGALLFLGFPTTEQFELPKCVRSFRLNGTLAAEGFTSSVLAPTNESYRVQVVDCFNLGFGNSWYKNATTAEQAEITTVDGVFGELQLEGQELGGSGFFECNGEEITIRGTAGADDLRGTAERDVISGLGGNDTIAGLGGDDIICGGDGNDRILGNAGADWIDAGPGDDWVGAGWGDDTIYGGAGNDFIRAFKHNDFVDGGTGNDRIKGGWGNDVLRGGAGNDIIRAYFGADQLFGDAGNDVLRAGNGPDVLVGGPGPADRLFGDQGRDDCRDVGESSVFTECETVNGE